MKDTITVFYIILTIYIIFCVKVRQLSKSLCKTEVERLDRKELIIMKK